MHFMHFLIKPFVSQVTFVTQTGYDVFKRNYAWPDHMVGIIENGAYIPSDYSISIGPPLRLGSVGRMVELKGQRLLLQALQQMQKNSVNDKYSKYQLHFYGTGPLEPELREIAATITAGEIVFHGQVTDIASIYADIDVLVVGSRIEGLSMVIIEAMARGIPVIATSVGGNPTLVKHEATGILVDFGDIDAMENAIRQFLDKPELVQTYGKAARTLVSEQYSLVDTHMKFLGCYQS